MKEAIYVVQQTHTKSVCSIGICAHTHACIKHTHTHMYDKGHTTNKILSAFEVGPSLRDLSVPFFVSFIVGKDLKGDLNSVINR